MKELNHQQDQCVLYAKDAVEGLSKFFKQLENDNEGLFYVSYSHEKEFGKAKLEPNAATSIICSVFGSLDIERAKALLGNDTWAKLNEHTRKAATCVANYENLDEALPLKTMGKLPLHSTAHLAQLLLFCDTHKIETNQPVLESVLLAICIRRLIVAIELDLKADNLNSRERLHPYHLYVATHALCDLIEYNNRDIKHEERRLHNKLQNFKVLMKNCENELLNAIIKKYELQPNDIEQAKTDLEFASDTCWDEIESSIDDSYFQLLFARIEERALVLAQAQIANKASSVSPDFDPSSLTFATATLSEVRTERYQHIIFQGLNLLFQVFEDEDFASTIPFMVDDKGRAAFVPSVETANTLLKVCEEQLKESRAAELERAANVALSFQRRLEMTKQKVSCKNLKISGWCSDKAPSKGRIDSWVTAYALEFFYRSHEIVKLEKRRKIFENYSWKSYINCKPTWNDIVDPNHEKTADNNVKEPIKTGIMELINSNDKKRLAPVFLLYGPPGTSKTSFVNGVAQAKKWDLISLSPSDFISDSVDRIEHRARQIFHDLMNIDECVILFDEMDSLLLDRDGKAADDDVLKFVVPAFLPKLQDLHDHVAKNQMAVFFVTNYAERIDSAIKRKGRIDKKILIPPYNETAREVLLSKLLVGVDGVKEELISQEESKSVIQKALSFMSPMSVYREMVEFAYCFRCEVNKLVFDEKLAESVYSDGLSIPSKTYDFELRGEAAKEEFLKILEQIITTVPKEKWKTLTVDGKANESEWEKIKNTLKSGNEFNKWQTIIKKWLEKVEL